MKHLPTALSMPSLRLVLSMALLSLLFACTTDTYETGDGKYSYLRADFAVAHSGTSKSLLEATTDDGARLVFDSPLPCSWATTPDSLYRALIYYSQKEVGAQVTGHSAHQVLVLPMKTGAPENMHTDPRDMESAWLSANGKYLNLGLYVKTGTVGDKDARQSIGLVRDTIIALDGDVHEHRLRLYHNQNGVPAYYSSKVYASIPLDSFALGDILHLDVNTFEGVVTRRFELR